MLIKLKKAHSDLMMLMTGDEKVENNLLEVKAEKIPEKRLKTLDGFSFTLVSHVGMSYSP
jgi:hypothetical protein